MIYEHRKNIFPIAQLCSTHTYMHRSEQSESLNLSDAFAMFLLLVHYGEHFTIPW